MKYEEIMKLLDAGYTKEEIIAMNNQAETDPEPEVTEPAADDLTKAINEELSNALSELRNTFDGFKKEIQALNIMNSQMDIPEVTAEDLIGKIINPFEGKE